MDRETFLTTLYVLLDDFCRTLPVVSHPGPLPALSRSEALTLALFARFGRFRSDRDFYGWAQRYLRREFPKLPDRTQWLRQVLRERATLERFAVALAATINVPAGSYEALDRTSVPIRNRKRRGRSWLPDHADLGLGGEGWFFGFSVLIAVQADGVITGWGFGSASAKDQPLAEVMLAGRQAVRNGEAPIWRDPKRPSLPPLSLYSVGRPPRGAYLADRGFQGVHLHAQWRRRYGAQVWSPPQDSRSMTPWPRELRRALAGLRQIVETVIAKISGLFGLSVERPHTLAGFACRLAARMAIHNCCIWVNQQLHRPNLAFAELLTCC